MALVMQALTLGKTTLQIPPLGIGCWAWGDRFFWGFGRNYNENDVKEAFDSSLAAGINFFDTAEVYGQGRSERLLGEFVHQTHQPVVIATKFFPFPWRLKKTALLHALQDSLKRLNLEQVDLYQIHSPFPPISIETWAEGLVLAVQSGLARAVGVSNYNAEQMQRAVETLSKYGIPLASNQVDYSLLDRKVELNGLLKTCQDSGVTLIAYSPLGQGVLSGKYSPENPPPGVRGRRYNRAFLEKIQPLLRLLRDFGRAHIGKTPSQVALNWVIQKGAVPIPGAKNARQAQDNAGALGWQLSVEEVVALDEASAKIG